MVRPGRTPGKSADAPPPTVGNSVVVSNTRGIDARRSAGPAHGTHDTTSSVQWFTLPNDHAINGYTAKVFAQNGWIGNSVQTRTRRRPISGVLVYLHASDAGASVAPCRREHLCATRVEPAAVQRSVDQAAGDENTGSGV